MLSLTGIRSRNTLALIPAGLLVLSLTACSFVGSSEPSPSETSNSSSSKNKCFDASNVIDQVIEDAPKRIPEILLSGSFDPAELVAPVWESLDAAKSEATNPDTLAAIENVRTEWEGLVTDFEALTPPDGELGGLEAIGATKTYADDLVNILTTRIPTLRDSTTALKETCDLK